MDIDIDFQTNFDANKIFDTAIPASMVKKNELVKHPCGQYFQNIAIDEITGLSAIPYEEAEILGYIKIDFLHLSSLDLVDSKEELRALLKKNPKWELLHKKENTAKLLHINRHFDLIDLVRPTSIIELADCLALIRPGKKELLSKYLKSPDMVRELLYVRGRDEKYVFKKSHAIAYASMIVIQLHLIEQHRL